MRTKICANKQLQAKQTN